MKRVAFNAQEGKRPHRCNPTQNIYGLSHIHAGLPVQRPPCTPYYGYRFPHPEVPFLFFQTTPQIQGSILHKGRIPSHRRRKEWLQFRIHKIPKLPGQVSMRLRCSNDEICCENNTKYGSKHFGFLTAICFSTSENRCRALSGMIFLQLDFLCLFGSKLQTIPQPLKRCFNRELICLYSHPSELPFIPNNNK